MSLFGRNRDDRRRRALAEESAGEGLAAPMPPLASTSKAEKPQRYTAAAKRENHKRATDYLPRGRISLAGWFLVGLVCVAGLLLAFANATGEKIAELGLANLFDASQGGSLAGWFSSFVFGVAAMASVLIYTIRRHKLDDYRGRYRLWLWCAAAWVVMSIDATANLHAPLSRAMAKATGWSMLPEGAIWWIGVWAIVMTILGLRLLFEVRQCRTAMLGIFGVTALWCGALAIELGWLPIHEHAAPAAIGCRLAGQVTLLLVISVYARHVLLDAEGLLKVREQKAKKEKTARKKKPTPASSQSSSSGQSYRTDAAHKAADKRTDLQGTSPNRGPASNYANSSSSTTSSNSSNGTPSGDEDDDRYANYDDDDDDANFGNRKLSKAERKKIRKQMRRQQREEGYDDDR